MHCMIQMALAGLFVWGRILKVTFARYFLVNVRESGRGETVDCNAFVGTVIFILKKKSVTDLRGSHEV